jgi:hypothetical protein
MQQKMKELAVKYLSKDLKSKVVQSIQFIRSHLDPRERVLPDFLIIGVQKGGTTSLFRYLSAHEQVMPSLLKGTFFFYEHFDKGEPFYRANFPLKRNMYHGDKKNKLTGESTADYIYHYAVPARVASMLPEGKFIAVFRDPVERAISEYFFLERHRKYPKTFHENIREELARLQADIDRQATYEEMYAKRNAYPHLLRSLYAPQVAHWLDYFPRDQFLFLQSEKLYREPATTMREVYTFLGINDELLDSYPAHNVTKKKNKVAEDTKAELRAFFSPYNARLEKLTGLSLTW